MILRDVRNCCQKFQNHNGRIYFSRISGVWDGRTDGCSNHAVFFPHDACSALTRKKKTQKMGWALGRRKRSFEISVKLANTKGVSRPVALPAIPIRTSLGVGSAGAEGKAWAGVERQLGAFTARHFARFYLARLFLGKNFCT